MGKVLKIFVSFLVIISFGLSGIWTAEKISPGFREDVELFLKIDDENAISTLKDKNAKLEEQIANYEGRIETLKLKISDLELTVEELGIEDEFLRSEIQRLQARVKELENQVENLDGTIDDLNAQIVEMNKEVDALWNIYNNLGEYENAVNNGTSADTQLTESEKALLEEKIESLEETVKELTEEIKELNETIEDLEEQIENLENQKSEAQKDKENNNILIVDKTKNIEELNVTVNNYHKEIEVIDNSIINNEIIINELQAKQENGEGLSEKEAKQLEDLKSQNKAFESQKYDINKNLTECEERVATLQEEVANLEIANAEFERQIASIDNQITTLQEEVTALESEAVSVQSNINSLRDRINKFNGLIGNSTIVDSNGEVVEQPSNPVNPETPENPPVDGELTLNIQGQSMLNLPLAKMQSADEITSVISNEQYLYEEFLKEDDFSGLFTIFPNATNIYMVANVADENVMSLVILFENEVEAESIFTIFEANKEIFLDDGIQLNCIAQCGKVGIIEVYEIPCEHIPGEVRTILQNEDDFYYYYIDQTLCANCGSEISSNFYSVAKGETVECSHTFTSQSQENYVETDTSYSYDLVIICQDCGKEISRQTITGTKSTNYTALNEEELIVALNTAKDGDTININGLISLSSPLTIDKNLTINGGVIEGSPIYVKSNNVTISNVSFNGIFKQNETQDSSIYASNFSGSLNIEYCNFSTSEWESIQITPTAGASITINACNFSSSNANQQRYIHIEGNKDEIVDCKIQIVNNNFNNLDILDTADENQNNGEAIGIYYCNLEQIYVADNVFNGNLSVEELQAKVCIANESPWTASESIIAKNTFNSLLEV